VEDTPSSRRNRVGKEPRVAWVGSVVNKPRGKYFQSNHEAGGGKNGKKWGSFHLPPEKKAMGSLCAGHAGEVASLNPYKISQNVS